MHLRSPQSISTKSGYPVDSRKRRKRERRKGGKSCEMPHQGRKSKKKRAENESPAKANAISGDHRPEMPHAHELFLFLGLPMLETEAATLTKNRLGGQNQKKKKKKKGRVNIKRGRGRKSQLPPLEEGVAREHAIRRDRKQSIPGGKKKPCRKGREKRQKNHKKARSELRAASLKGPAQA